jgi:hypothetical protein
MRLTHVIARKHRLAFGFAVDTIIVSQNLSGRLANSSVLSSGIFFMLRMHHILLACLVGQTFSGFLHADDWPQWMGP